MTIQTLPACFLAEAVNGLVSTLVVPLAGVEKAEKARKGFFHTHGCLDESGDRDRKDEAASEVAVVECFICAKTLPNAVTHSTCSQRQLEHIDEDKCTMLLNDLKGVRRAGD